MPLPDVSFAPVSLMYPVYVCTTIHTTVYVPELMKVLLEEAQSMVQQESGSGRRTDSQTLEGPTRR